MDSSWIYTSQSLAHIASTYTVNNITLCAQKPTPPAPKIDGFGHNNHWVLYLAGENQQQAFRVEPKPAGLRYSIEVKVTMPEDYRQSLKEECVKTVNLTPVPETSAKGVTDEILGAVYDEYRLVKHVPNGHGVRYWVYAVVRLLQFKGILTNSEEVNVAEETLKLVWDKSGNPAPEEEQSEMLKGDFAKPPANW